MYAWWEPIAIAIVIVGILRAMRIGSDCGRYLRRNTPFRQRVIAAMTIERTAIIAATLAALTLVASSLLRAETRPSQIPDR
jgi:uncharacterized membrane protein